MTALIRLALFYGDVGRSPPWKDRAKAFELFSLAAPFADQRAQYGYATGLHYGYTVAKDPAKAYVHYELARQLGSKSAEARLKTLDELLSPSEKAAAIEEARLRRRELKPNPDILIVQHPELPQPPSPWAAQSSDGATTVRQP
jgi:TPR repeat protein